MNKLSFEMSDECRMAFDSAMKRDAIDERSLLVRALALYDLVSEHRTEGGKLIFRHKDGTEECLEQV